MTPKNFAIVACRLLAVWFFVQAAQSSVNSVVAFFSVGGFGYFGTQPQSVFFLSAPPLIHFCAAVVLWLGASVLAEIMARGTEKSRDDKDKIGIGGWQAVGFSVIGMFLCAQGVIAVVGNVASYLFTPLSLYGSYDASKTWTNIIVGGAQFLVGLALLFYAQKTIRVLDHLQRGGRDETSSGQTLNDENNTL